ncbi:MAG TPA: hypothetical protein VFQ53_25660 [Kofleriaceae bacterium]|nr:hypothetical protein [Kofleriaceae bacterium]
MVLGGCQLVFPLDGPSDKGGLPFDAGSDGSGDGELPLDLDKDGLPDVTDPCIQPSADLLVDFEADAKPNATDPCPFVFDSNDTDLDGIPDNCDPFPMISGDRRRCTMAFESPEINQQLWLSREGTPGWDLANTALIGSKDAGPTTIASAVELEHGVSTTYEVSATLAAEPASMFAGLILRGSPQYDDTDIGCGIAMSSGTGTQLVLARGNSNPLQAVSFGGTIGGTFTLRIAATVEATGRVRCVAQLNGSIRLVEALIPDKTSGLFGFGTSGFQFTIDGLAIYERDDARLTATTKPTR